MIIIYRSAHASGAPKPISRSAPSPCMKQLSAILQVLGTKEVFVDWIRLMAYD